MESLMKICVILLYLYIVGTIGRYCEARSEYERNRRELEERK